jgi:hypothetical protein
MSAVLRVRRERYTASARERAAASLELPVET